MKEHDNDRDELRSIQKIFENTVKNNSINDLKPYCDPEFSFVSFTDRSFSNFDEFSDQWRKTRDDMVGTGTFTTDLDPEPSIFNDNIAVCSGNSKNIMIDKKGHSYNFTSHWTVVFRRSDGKWKVLRAHNSLNPFSNPMLNRAIKTTMIKLSFAFLLLGGAICSLITYLIPA